MADPNTTRTCLCATQRVPHLRSADLAPRVRDAIRDLDFNGARISDTLTAIAAVYREATTDDLGSDGCNPGDLSFSPTWSLITDDCAVRKVRYAVDTTYDFGAELFEVS